MKKQRWINAATSFSLSLANLKSWFPSREHPRSDCWELGLAASPVKMENYRHLRPQDHNYYSYTTARPDGVEQTQAQQKPPCYYLVCRVLLIFETQTTVL